MHSFLTCREVIRVKPNRRDFLLVAMATATFPRGLVMPEIKKTQMWFAHPADRWLQGLPVGNGRLGAMVFGGAARERWPLTESTLWSGAPAVRDLNPAARESIPAIRNLFFAGRYSEAEELCRKNLLGRGSQFGTALPMAFLEIETILQAEISRYRRSLDLDEAIARVEFATGNVMLHREVFASHPAGVIVVRVESGKPGGLSCNIAFGEPRLPGEVTVETGSLALNGHAWESLHSDGRDGTRFECQVRVIPEYGPESGEMHSADGKIRVQAANAVT